MNNKFKFSVYDMAIVGVMAAICFVTTYFIKIEIPTPAGVTMLKIGNVFCLLSGILFGGLRGGLSAGIGSMMFDLLDPKYIASAPFTLVFFFIMGFVCGTIAFLNNKKGSSTKLNIIAGIVGSLSYIVLHISKSIIVLMLAGSGFIPALIACVPKILTSLINAGIAVTIACLLAPVLRTALKRAGFYNKLVL